MDPCRGQGTRKGPSLLVVPAGTDACRGLTPRTVQRDDREGAGAAAADDDAGEADADEAGAEEAEDGEADDGEADEDGEDDGDGLGLSAERVPGSGKPGAGVAGRVCDAGCLGVPTVDAADGLTRM